MDNLKALFSLEKWFVISRFLSCHKSLSLLSGMWLHFLYSTIIPRKPMLHLRALNVIWQDLRSFPLKCFAPQFHRRGLHPRGGRRRRHRKRPFSIGGGGGDLRSALIPGFERFEKSGGQVCLPAACLSAVVHRGGNSGVIRDWLVHMCCTCTNKMIYGKCIFVFYKILSLIWLKNGNKC